MGTRVRTIFEVIRANNIVDVISKCVKLSQSGENLVGLCPFHGDHRPSMYVNETNQTFKCLACGAQGDVLKFIQMKENLTSSQAIDSLAQRVGIEISPEFPEEIGEFLHTKYDKKTIGQYLKESRENRCIHIGVIANESGFHLSTIKKVESGQSLPTPNYIDRMIGLLNLDKGMAYELGCRDEIKRAKLRINKKWWEGRRIDTVW